MIEKFINWLIEILADLLFWLDDLLEDEEEQDFVIFDDNSGIYPTHLGKDRLPVGYVEVKRNCFLWTPDENNVLDIYENDAWANNTLGKRIQPKEGKRLAVYARGNNWHYGNPRPNEYDGASIAWVVMKEQTPIDGKDLMQFIDDGNLIFTIRLEDVAEWWMPVEEEENGD
jgi:hypothetical protein